MWLIYALGGGWGHLTRAIALTRIAARDRAVRILTNSPYAAIAAAALPELDIVTLETRAEVVHEIAACQPSCLIVDTFPRGVGGELADVLRMLDVPKVLVHRDLTPRYVAEMRLREFVTAHFDLILVPGPGEGSQLGDLPTVVETDAWLVRSADELRPGQANCVLVCAGGNKDELSWYGEVARALRRLDPNVPLRVVAAECPPHCPPECWIRYWPAIDLFGSAAVVIGGAGYNTVRECLAWEVPLVARAWPRTYDRQDVRAATAASSGLVTLVVEAEEAARQALAQMQQGKPRVPRFRNGAEEAVRRICVTLRFHARRRRPGGRP